MKDKLITLANGKQYCLLDSVNYNGYKYYVGVEYFKDKNDVNNDNFYVFKSTFSNDDDFFEIVTDKELIEYIIIKSSLKRENYL